MEQQKNKEKLQEIEKKIASLKAQAKRIKSVENKKKRAEETRKKILVGSWLLSKVKKGEYENQKLINNMDQFLDKDIDRKLFGLKPKPKNCDS